MISTFFAVLLFNPNLQWNCWDTYEYINLGKSLEQGTGFRQIWYPDEPLGSRLPFAYPYLLSLLMMLSENIIFLKCFSLGCYIVNIFLVYYLYQKFFKLPDVIVFVLVLTFSLNSITLNLSHIILSETPFLLLVLTSFIFAMNYVKHDRNINVYLFLASFSMIFAWQIRSLGLAIIFAIFLYLFIEKRFSRLSFLLMCTSLISFIFLSFSTTPIGSEFSLENYGYFSSLMAQLSQPQALAQSIYKGFFNYFHVIPTSIFGFIYDTIGHFNFHMLIIFKILMFLFSLIVMIMITVGYFNLFGSNRLSCLFVGIYLTSLIFWPYFQSSPTTRFIFPVLPFLLMYFYTGLKLTIEKTKFDFKEKTKDYLTLGICIVILISSIGEKLYKAFDKNENIYVLYKNKVSSYPLEWKNYFNGLMWLEKNVLDNSIILTRDSSLCFLITGHKSVSVEWTPSINDLMRLIKDNNVDYVIANPYYKKSNEKFLFSAIRQNPNDFFQVYGNHEDSVRIFKIIKTS